MRSYGEARLDYGDALGHCLEGGPRRWSARPPVSGLARLGLERRGSGVRIESRLPVSGHPGAGRQRSRLARQAAGRRHGPERQRRGRRWDEAERPRVHRHGPAFEADRDARRGLPGHKRGGRQPDERGDLGVGHHGDARVRGRRHPQCLHPWTGVHTVCSGGWTRSQPERERLHLQLGNEQRLRIFPRWGAFDQLARDERSGSWHGLLRAACCRCRGERVPRGWRARARIQLCRESSRDAVDAVLGHDARGLRLGPLCAGG